MQSSNFRHLAVYRRAANLSDEIRRCVEHWPSLDKWSVGIQAVRAADSIGANIAEAEGRWSRQDQRRLQLIARGSAYELEHWIERAMQRQLPLAKETADEALAVIRMLNAYIRASRPAA